MRVTHHHLVPLTVLEPQASKDLKPVPFPERNQVQVCGQIREECTYKRICVNESEGLGLLPSCTKDSPSFWLHRLFLAVLGLVIAVTSPVAERGPWGPPASVVVARGLQSTDSKAVVRRLSCSTAYGIFLHLGSNPCLLCGQTDSHPPYHQQSPRAVLFM